MINLRFILCVFVSVCLRLRVACRKKFRADDIQTGCGAAMRSFQDRRANDGSANASRLVCVRFGSTKRVAQRAGSLENNHGFDVVFFMLFGVENKSRYLSQPVALPSQL